MMNNSEKDIFRRALADDAWCGSMDDALRARIAAGVTAEHRRRERRADRLSGAAAGFLSALILAAVAVSAVDCMPSLVAPLRDAWIAVRGDFAEIYRRFAQTDLSAAMPCINVVLTIFGYSLLALWIDVRRARREMREK